MSKKIALYNPKVCDSCGAKTVVYRVEDGGDVEIDVDVCLTCGDQTETRKETDGRPGFAYGFNDEGEEVLITLPFSLTNARKKVEELLARDNLELLLATHWGMDANCPVWLHGNTDVFNVTLETIETTNKVPCPRCGGKINTHTRIITTTGEREAISCHICGYRKTATGATLEPRTYARGYYLASDTVGSFLDEMPPVAAEARKWLKRKEREGYAFPVAVIVMADNSLVWLRGYDAFQHEVNNGR